MDWSPETFIVLIVLIGMIGVLIELKIKADLGKEMIRQMGRYQVQRTDTEVDRVLNTCLEREESGKSPLWSLTYEQGVEAGIKWLTGETDDDPIEE